MDEQRGSLIQQRIVLAMIIIFILILMVLGVLTDRREISIDMRPAETVGQNR